MHSFLGFALACSQTAQAASFSKSIEISLIKNYAASPTAYHISWSPNSQKVSAVIRDASGGDLVFIDSTDGSMSVFNGSNVMVNNSLQQIQPRFMALSWSQLDENTIITGDYFGNAVEYNLSSAFGQRKFTNFNHYPIYDIQYSSANDKIALTVSLPNPLPTNQTALLHGPVQIFDADTWLPIELIDFKSPLFSDGHGQVIRIFWNSAGNSIAVTTTTGIVGISDVKGVSDDLLSTTSLHNLTYLNSTTFIKYLSWSPDCKQIATINMNDSWLRIWNVETGALDKEIVIPNISWLTAACWFDNDILFVTGEYLVESEPQYSALTVVDVNTLTIVNQILDKGFISQPFIQINGDLQLSSNREKLCASLGSHIAIYIIEDNNTGTIILTSVGLGAGFIISVGTIYQFRKKKKSKRTNRKEVEKS